MPTLEDVRAAKNDFGLFCSLVGKPRTPWQIDAMELRKRQTVVVAPRQCGKSESLSLKAAHAALRKPNQLIMIVSASETAAVRLLYAVREAFDHPLLKGSLAEEPTQTRIVLKNGSRILSVPASEKSIRGWSVDLLIVDECAFVADDILLSAALPTTTARPDARVVLASTPWGDAGAFFNLAMQGMGDDEHTETFRWKLLDAPWIHPAVVEAARRSLPPLRFRAEYEGEFITSGDAYFDRMDLLACTADYPLRDDGQRMPAVCGLDWGRQQDAHAIAIAAVLMDYGVNPRPVVVVPWVETSRRSYTLQGEEIERLSKLWTMDIHTETNGVGAAPSERLVEHLVWTRVVKQASTQKSKEDSYGRLKVLFDERSIVIPQHEELLRQLGGITATATSNGGLRIEARQESVHDDLPDALALAAGKLPLQMESCPKLDVPEGMQWVETPEGVRVPVPVLTRNAEPDWGAVYSGLVSTSKAPVQEAPNPWLEVYGSKKSAAQEVFRKLKEISS